jgi:hypothetical protein
MLQKKNSDIIRNTITQQMTSNGNLEAATHLDNSVIQIVYDHQCHLRACNRNYGEFVCGDGINRTSTVTFTDGSTPTELGTFKVPRSKEPTCMQTTCTAG